MALRLRLTRAFVLIGCFVFASYEAWGQNCILTGLNHTSISSSCGQQCRDLKFQIPDISGTSTYTVVNIPYNPYPYVTAGATEDPNLYNDDQYSAVFSLPFPFCFYDSVYTKALISSNGLVTFDTTYAGSFQAAYLSDSTIPHSSRFSGSVDDYPRASIMAAYMDLDPRPGPLFNIFSSPSDRKIEWRVEGTAPCRRFVVSYFHIGAFIMTPCGQNPDSAATFQIVMYESTGLIDVFIQSKFCSVLTPSGAKAILGVQDFSRTKAVAAPGKNAAPWTASNEGYRFVPSGGASRFVSSELLAMDLSHIAFANSSRSTPGLLDLTFPNICSRAPSTQYIVKTTYSACENSATLLTSLDTITINLTGSINATATTTNTSCGPPSGTITVNVPTSAMPPFSYVLDGGAPVSSPAFTHTFINVAQGPHTVVVTDGNNSCSGSINITVNRNNTLSATTSSTASAACRGGGTITVTPVNGSAPYNFSLDGGSPQTSALPFTFRNVAGGPHNIIVTDATGCTTSIEATITQPAQLVASETHTAIACNGGNSSITITASGGTAPYTGTGTFSRPAGTFSFVVTDSNGCTDSVTTTIAQPTALTARATSTPVTTPGGSDGRAAVTPSGGSSPYTYLWSPGGQTTQTASGLTAGTYTVTVTDSQGCTATAIVTIGSPACNISLSFTKTDVSCFGGSNGTAAATVTGASGTLSYAWSNGQTTQTGTGLTAGIYSITVTDGVGCTASGSVGITQPTQLTASETHTAVACSGGSSTVTITASGGTAPYTGTGTFTRAAGTFNFIVTDNNGCTASVTTTITQPAALTANATSTPVTTIGSSDGTATVTASGGTPPYTYLWSPGGQRTQTATGLAAGTYTVTVTDSQGCTITASATVGSPPCSISLSITKTGASCFGGSDGAATVIATNATGTLSYAWSNGQTTQTATGLTAGSYSVTVTDGAGCSASGSVTITQPSQLTASESNTAIACSGGSSTVTITASGGTDPYTGTGTFTRAAGTFNFIVTDNNGCTASVTTTITQPTALTASATSTPVTTPGGLDGTATVTPSGGSSPYTYLWSPGGQTTQTASGLKAGSYTVTVTDSQGCTATATVTIGSPACNISLSFTKTDVSCFGGSNGAAAATVTGASGTLSYAWTNGQTTQTAAGLTAGIYSVTVTDGVGCTASGSVTITQPTQPTASETHTAIACSGGSSTVTITASGGTAPYTGTGTFTRAAGTFNFIVTDNNGCTALAPTTITQPAALTANTTSTAVTTIGSSDGTATVTPSGGTPPYTYLWSPGGQRTQTAIGLAADTYTVTVTDSNGCTVTASTTVSSPGCNMSLSFTTNDVSCFGGSDGAATVTASNATGTLSYAWNNGQTTQTAAGLTAGSYSVTVTDGAGCSASGSVTITQPTQLTASETHTAIVCNGGTSTITITASGGTAPYTGTGTFTRAAGTFNLIVTDNNGCTASVTTSITQPTALTAHSVNSNASCDPRNEGAIAVTANGGNGDYQYSLNGRPFQTSNIFNVGAGNYIVSVKDDVGCMTTINSTVALDNDLHVTVLPHDTSSYTGDKFQLTAKSTASMYTWFPATGLSDPNVSDPFVDVGVLGEDVTYRVTASTPEGCKGENYVRIKAYKSPDIYVPTGFTPNHDGKNDKFTPIPVGIKKINYFKVFNRWGEVVFATTAINEGWDGKLHGVEQPADVYVWMVQGVANNDRIITKKGTVVLIR